MLELAWLLANVVLAALIGFGLGLLAGGRYELDGGSDALAKQNEAKKG